jgi:hypothetical protein
MFRPRKPGRIIKSPPVRRRAPSAAHRGATLVPVDLNATNLPTRVWDYEFKEDLNAYLSKLPAQDKVRTLADVIAYNQAHAQVALKFGETLLEGSQAISVDDPSTAAGYEALRVAGLAEAQSRIDTTLKSNNITAVVFAGTSGNTIVTRAAYPAAMAPAGYQAGTRHPEVLEFVGTGYSEAKLLGYAYDYELATKLWTAPSVINPTLFRCFAASGPNRAEHLALLDLKAATGQTSGHRTHGAVPTSRSGEASLSGDEVELVAFDVAKGGPARFALFDGLDLLGAEAEEPAGLGLELGGDEVEMNSVLHRLRFGHLVEREAGPVDGRVINEHDRVLSGWVLGYLAPEDLGPEPGDGGGVDAIDGDAEEGVGHLGVLLEGVVGPGLIRQRCGRRRRRSPRQ